MATETRSLDYRCAEAYRVDSSWIRRVVAEFQNLEFQEVDISVDVGPDRHLSRLTVDELLALPNTRAELVKNIRLNVSRYDNNPLFIGVYLSDASYELRVSGANKEAIYAFERLKILMEDLRVWYSRLRRDGFWTSLGCTISILVFSSSSVSLLLLALRTIGTSVPANLMGIAVIINVTFIAAALLNTLGGWIAKRLFPFTEVLIGDGIRRSISLSETRRNIVWVIAGGMVVTIGGALLIKLLGLG